jgi:hypothetical protein
MSGIEKTLREPPGDIIFSCALIAMNYLKNGKFSLPFLLDI